MFRKRHPAPGAVPGSMVIPAEALPPRIHVIDYGGERFEERDVDDAKELVRYRASATTTWVDVQGLGDQDVLQELGAIFSMHPLALADTVNVPQRPKVESYQDNLLIITRMVRMPEPPALEAEQLGILLGPDYVVTFQEHYGDVLDPVRVRLRLNGTIRQAGADYLAYAILDAVIDGYYPVLEELADHFEEIEEEVISRSGATTLRAIHFLKRELLALHRGIWPQRDAINSLLRDPQPLVSDSVRVYLRDCYDHAIQVSDVVETYRELATSLMDMHLSSASNRLNEVMKVLTIIATIFIPLSFIAGVYGMNFAYMPELHLRWGYPAVWLVMLAVGGGLLLYFYRRGWLSGGAQEDAPSTDGPERR